MVGGKLDFEKKIPPMGEGLGGEVIPPMGRRLGGKFSILPPHHGGEVGLGWPAAGGKFCQSEASK